MSRSTRNSMDVALFAAGTPAASSDSASQPNSSSSSQQTFAPISSSVSSSAQLSPDFLSTVVQVVKAAFAAKHASSSCSLQHYGYFGGGRCSAFRCDFFTHRQPGFRPTHIIPFGHWIKSSIALFLTHSIFPAR